MEEATSEAAAVASAAIGESSTEVAAAAQRARVYWDGSRFLVWNARHAYELRGAHRIVGSMVGALPTNKRQTCEHGMPLSLMLEEAILVAEEGIGDVVDVSTHQAGRGDATTEGVPEPWPPARGWLPFEAERKSWADESLEYSPLRGRLRLQHLAAGHTRTKFRICCRNF